MSKRQPIVEIDRESNRVLFYIREKPNGFLSNFERSPFAVDDVWYPTNEHFYQSTKAIDPKMQAWIREAPNAWAAMKAGRALRKHETRPNWNEFNKFRVMKRGLQAKFSQNDNLREALLRTGNASLHEDSPTDMIWGIKGRDMLGELLMEVRDELKGYKMKVETLTFSDGKVKDEDFSVEKIGNLTTSAVGLRKTADYLEETLGTDGNVNLEHFIAHTEDGMISGIIIPERPPKCPDCGSTDVNADPEGAFCKKCNEKPNMTDPDEYHSL